MGSFSKMDAKRKAAPESATVLAKQFEVCQDCQETYLYPNLKDSKGPGNRIVGRSMNMGFLCRDCYERGANFDHIEASIEAFKTRHRDDEWGALLTLSKSLSCREDRLDYLRMMRKKVAKLALQLPYDPSMRVSHEHQ